MKKLIKVLTVSFFSKKKLKETKTTTTILDLTPREFISIDLRYAAR